MTESPLHRLHAVVRGRVQGVGFRYFTRHVATALDLTGWVRNGDDGSVELEAQGAAAAVDQFRAALRQGPPLGRVREVVESAVPLVGGEDGFRIRH